MKTWVVYARSKLDDTEFSLHFECETRGDMLIMCEHLDLNVVDSGELISSWDMGEK